MDKTDGDGDTGRGTGNFSDGAVSVAPHHGPEGEQRPLVSSSSGPRAPHGSAPERPVSVAVGGELSVAADEPDQVWGVFYIKPNFPGRCSHVCNGGFITDPRRRRRGVAKVMGYAFLRLARDLGYVASYFNLVSSVWASFVLTYAALVHGPRESLCAVHR